DRWHKDILFVAGWPLNIEDNFYSPSDKLAAMVSPVYDIAKVYHGSAYQNKEDLINRLNQGVAVAVFYGHGGAQLWSHGSFFWYYDVPRLNNWGRWPLIGSFTCSSGAFESPLYTSISESFIFNNGGAIGVYTSSGASYGDSITGCTMENTFMDAWDRRGFRYLGDIALSSKYSLAGGLPPSGQTLDMLASYNLLGDPAVRLALPDTGLRVEISQTAVLPGDSTQIKITGPFGSGLAVVSLYDSGRRIVLQNAFSSSAGQAQTYITIPDSALSGQAYLKIYLKDDNSDWVAVEYLGISRPAVSGIKVIPSAPTDIDSIQITGIVQSLSGIDSVWCRWRWGSYNDTTDTGGVFKQALMSLSGDSARLNNKLYLTGLEGNYPPQSEIYLVFRILAQDTFGNITTGRWENHKILRRADLAPSSQAQGSVYLGGKRVLTINASIKNQGDIDADSIPVYFYRSSDDSILGFGSIDTIAAGKEKKLSLPWTIEGEFTQLYYRIDPLRTLISPYPQEDTTNDKSVAYWVPSQDFYYYQLDARGNNQDTLDYYSKAKAFFPDSCLHDSAVAIIGRKLFDINAIAQSGLIPFDSLGQAYFVGLIDSSRVFDNSRELWVSLKLENIDSTTDLNNLKLFRLEDITGMWQLIPSQIDSNYISGYSPKPGTFAAMYSTDTTGPHITAKVDQQAVGWGQIISVPDPQYSVMIEDRDGINVDSIWLKLDNQIISKANYSLAINPDKNYSVQLVYSAKLDNGKHSLEVGAADNLGNKSSLKIFNDVKIEFSLKEIANYPNPVNGDITTFYFFVGAVADRYEVKIFTVAGRQIKTFKGGLTSGVRTFEWDLCDDNGNGIANGVYFYKVIVFQNGTKLEKTGKMAILR
ncbi:MAG: T9SS type A sorting domain-containing protein, partial [Candidatus Edwardsbacteria bacterium]|nr:T9SS type A sorting domain-containing protein [Candidatus Edwardsbacteria bacterium]